MERFEGSKKGDNVTGLEQIKQYLIRYGYMSPTHVGNSHDAFDPHLEAAVKKYQVFFSLNVTGVLDSSTLTMMAAPRCGVPDHFDTEVPHNIGGSFYKFGPTRWPRFNLTWSVDMTSTGFDGLAAIDEALYRWQKASRFRFIDKNLDYDGPTDLTFGFYRKEHGDKSPFEGRGGAIAHAFYPPRGKVHFDDDELWAIEGELDPKAYDVTSTALHEIGHALGLAHSKDKNAIMWPSIKGGQVKDLNDDDVRGMREMYANF